MEKETKGKIILICSIPLSLIIFFGGIGLEYLDPSQGALIGWDMIAFFPAIGVFVTGMIFSLILGSRTIKIIAGTLLAILILLYFLISTNSAYKILVDILNS
jgi:hypothetical protein